MAENSGIYAIVCNSSWRSYVGSAINIISREKTHFTLLRNNKHTNKELQADFNQFGKDRFYFEIIEELKDKKSLLKREQYWIKQGCNLYNIDKSVYKIAPELSDKDIARFWSCVEKLDDCWTWKLDKSNFRPRFAYSGQRFNVTKIMCKLTKKEYDDSLIICHTCDNPKCINPDHLFLGTYSDNSIDKLKKNRGKNKLTFEIANEIRDVYSKNNLINSTQIKEWIESKYNIMVSNTCINIILRNKAFYNPNYQVFSRKDNRMSNLKQFSKNKNHK